MMHSAFVGFIHKLVGINSHKNTKFPGQLDVELLNPELYAPLLLYLLLWYSRNAVSVDECLF